jgi:hypothetical protein
MRALPLLVSLLAAAAVLAGCASKDSAPTTAPGQPTLSDPRFGSAFRYDATDANGLPVPVRFCFSGTDATAVAAGAPIPDGLRCNALMTPDEGRQGNEVTIAVNPQNPREVVGGAKDYYPTDAGQCVWDGVYVTHDGGRTTFQDRSFDGSPWRALSDPATFKPNYASQYWCTTDPVAYYSADGKSFYYLLMAYQGDPLTASKTCENVCNTPVGSGAVNDWAFNRAIQIVAVSHDGGDTFTTFTGVFEGSYPVMFHDKGWVAASNDGTIHVMWLASAVPGNLYFRSTDGGSTYLDPFVVAGPLDDSGQGSFVDVGPGKEVYAGWTGASINLRRSLDEGSTWLPIQHVLAPHNAAVPGLSDRDRRGGFAAMATDRYADSPLVNSVYFAFQDSCQAPLWSADCKDSAGQTDLAKAKDGENRANVYVVASHDGGKTFGTPVRVNDDAGPDGLSNPDAYQFMPAVSVSPGGVVDVQWFDTRDGGRATTANQDHARISQYYSYSLDGGKTWSRNVEGRELADGGWDPALCHHQDGKIFFGDYQDIDSSWPAAHLVWPDTRDGSCKVYTATLERPWFADGWDAAKRDAAEQQAKAHPL